MILWDLDMGKIMYYHKSVCECYSLFSESQLWFNLDEEVINKPDFQYFASIITIFITTIIIIIFIIFIIFSILLFLDTCSPLIPFSVLLYILGADSYIPPPRLPSSCFLIGWGNGEVQVGAQNLGYFSPTPSLLCLLSSHGCLPSTTASVMWPLLQEFSSHLIQYTTSSLCPSRTKCG